MPSDLNRVVVTGWGVLSSIGHAAEHHWSNLAHGVCGIAPMLTIPTDQLTQKVAAEVKNYDPLNFSSPSARSRRSTGWRSSV